MTDVSDSFNRANGGLGSNWLIPSSFTGMAIVSNAVSQSAATWAAAYWNPATNTFTSDQHATIQLISGNYGGPMVRWQASSQSGYMLFLNTVAGFGPYLYRIDSTAFTLISNPAITWAYGDTLGLSMTGSVITISQNGVNYGTTYTDATYTGGQPGFMANAGVVDNWTGGPITPVAFTVTPIGVGAGAGMILSTTMVGV